MFMGYLDDEVKTKEAIDNEGWLHSGDIGKVDNEGFLYITGRIKGKSYTPQMIRPELMTFLFLVNHHLHMKLTPLKKLSLFTL